MRDDSSIGDVYAYREHDGRLWLVTEYIVAAANRERPRIPELGATIAKQSNGPEVTLTPLRVTWNQRSWPLAADQPWGVVWLFERPAGGIVGIRAGHLTEVLRREAEKDGDVTVDELLAIVSLVQCGDALAIIRVERAEDDVCGWVMPQRFDPLQVPTP